ncbi:MAG: hypothetical protein H0V18_13525 [Pyrinomonadaceae bacterium]|nr:hypothetical protein [Pyrinomonadaceae bacterium]
MACSASACLAYLQGQGIDDLAEVRGSRSKESVANTLALADPAEEPAQEQEAAVIGGLRRPRALLVRHQVIDDRHLLAQPSSTSVPPGQIDDARDAFAARKPRRRRRVPASRIAELRSREGGVYAEFDATRRRMIEASRTLTKLAPMVDWERAPMEELAQVAEEAADLRDAVDVLITGLMRAARTPGSGEDRETTGDKRPDPTRDRDSERAGSEVEGAAVGKGSWRAPRCREAQVPRWRSSSRSSSTVVTSKWLVTPEVAPESAAALTFQLAERLVAGTASEANAGRPRREVPRRPQPTPPRSEPDESPANRIHRKSPVTRAFSVAGL